MFLCHAFCANKKARRLDRRALVEFRNRSERPRPPEDMMMVVMGEHQG
jgi:hypothetical protein